MAEFDSTVILLVLAWSGFFLIHSLLASLNIERHILTKLPQFAPCYRLAYNLVAVITLVPVVLIHALHEGKLVYHWPGIFSIITTALAILALFAFIWSHLVKRPEQPRSNQLDVSNGLFFWGKTGREKIGERIW